jgi:ATP-dependent DNA helicase RecG
MTKDELERIISKGEGLTVEFKLCKNGLTNSVFETVSSFSNRYGGHVILGIDDNGKIIGVNKNSVSDIKNNFIHTLNNPQRFSPTQFFSLEEIEINGKLLLWVYIPVNSQVVMFAGKIYDRAEGGDIDVSKNSDSISQLHLRKSHEYSERKLFPYAKEEDFEFERLMPKIRLLVQNRMPDHPWKAMSDMDILKSAGLYQKDRETGKFGFNLAAVLLFGKNDVIRSCTANYLTDAICRKENLDRYDDRLIVNVNLIDAYEQLIDFIAKHTLDRFYLMDGQSVSIRSKIAREIVSNILVHREYSSSFPAKIIIEGDKIVTENWNLPKHYGTINPENFTPYPKNPILANFFVNIGRADSLGSGIRNLYRFSKIYSGKEPILVEDDIFRTFIPIVLSDKSEINEILIDKPQMSDILSDKLSDKLKMSDILSDKSTNKPKINDILSDKSTNKPKINDILSDKSEINEILIDKPQMSDILSDKSTNKPQMSDILSDKKYAEMILAYVDKNYEINVAIAAKIIDRSQATARRILKKLVHEKFLNIVGGNKNRKYANDKKYAEKILAYIDKNGEINAAIAIKIIDRSQATTRRILKKLVCENILNAIGGNKNRKYMRKKQEK